MKSKLTKRISGFLMLLCTMIIFSSCTKSADESDVKNQQDKNSETTVIDEKNISETDADLTTVDYKEFYDQLAPHGEWIQVPVEEIGLRSETALKESFGNSYSISDILGIKSAYALSSAGNSMIYVWKPSAELAVTTEAAIPPVFVPYSNGQWVNTDAGWYFKAPTPVEETISHYGRWVNSEDAGWLWVPGRVWAPAWVDWKQNDEFVSWAPLPPAAYLVNGVINAPVIEEKNYLIVERKYFVEPQVYKYNYSYYDYGIPVTVNQLTGTEGIVFSNNVIVNKGPDVNVIQRFYGRNIEQVMIQHVKSINDVRYSEKEYKVYTPVFIRYKMNGNSKITVLEPKSYKKYDEWKYVKSKGKELNKSENETKNEVRKEVKKVEKEIRKVEKEVKKEVKKGVNEIEKVEKKIKKEVYGNDNGKKNNSNDNGNKKNDNEFGKEKK